MPAALLLYNFMLRRDLNFRETSCSNRAHRMPVTAVLGNGHLVLAAAREAVTLPQRDLLHLIALHP